jgi:RNA polymerase primary sigma factor
LVAILTEGKEFMTREHGNNLETKDDPLAQYFRDISTLSTLTREEEVKLARRIQQGDREALRELVEGNLRFVVSVAKKYNHSNIPLIDLINEGNIGLIRAAEKFDPDRGVKFITYAVWWVVAAIKYALAKQTGVIGLPLKHPNTVYKISRKKEELAKQLERDPTQDEVAEAMNISKEGVEAILKAARMPLSLDASICDDSTINYLDTLKADFEVDEGLVAEDRRKEIGNLVITLNKRKYDVISMRFGLNGYEPMTLREIGKTIGLSKERVRQIEEKALKILHETAKNRKLEVLLS